jgi:transposase
LLPSPARSPIAIREIRLDGRTILLEGESTTESAPCPECHLVSTHVHTRYRRRPLDLPWRGRVVRLVLTVRRFRCATRECPRHTFAEPVGERIPPRARRTVDVTEYLLQLARAAGGEAGARLAEAAGIPVSPDTLLRLLRQAGQVSQPMPRVLGVDDFALRRGQRYGTLLIDLETHRPVDMLSGRDAAVLAAWLQEHPGVEIIARDRAEAYAEGARAGAPDAVQVADRFHLAQNVSAALQEVLRGRRRQIEAVAVDTPPPQVEPVVAPPPPSRTKQREAAARAARVARWKEVQALGAQGMSTQSIARHLRMARRTVRHYRATPEAPQNAQRNPRPGGLTSPLLQPYVTYLQDRWQDGCTNITQLFREIVVLGYPGSRSLLAQALLAWRAPRPPKLAHGSGRRRKRSLNLRWLCLRRPDDLPPAERAALDQVLAADAELATGHALLHRFRRLLAARDLPALETWLADARSSGLPPFIAFATGLANDRAAVDGAFTTPWSTGPVEGHVHRVKLIKRQGYGRAKVDLLRARVLKAS